MLSNCDWEGPFKFVLPGILREDSNWDERCHMCYSLELIFHLEYCFPYL